MWGWILGGLATATFLSEMNECAVTKENNEHLTKEKVALMKDNCSLQGEKSKLEQIIKNQSILVRNFDCINVYAKSIGYQGAVSFFYDLANYHDPRFLHYARFINKVKVIRNDIAHNGTVYNIPEDFLNTLGICKRICNAYRDLPEGHRLTIR